MNQAQQIIPWLRQLAELEGTQRQLKRNSGPNASLAGEIESLRAQLPTSILTHRDAFKARGKLSIAPVTRGVCGACHLAIPRGHVAALRRVTDDLSVCDNCGVFIYLAEEEPPEATNLLRAMAVATRKTKPSKRTARRPVAGTRKSVTSR